MPGKSCAFPGTTPAPRRKVKMPYWFENCSLDPDRQELVRNGARVAVEPGVLDLLRYLIANRARVVSKDELIAQIWGGRIVRNRRSAAGSPLFVRSSATTASASA